MSRAQRIATLERTVRDLESTILRMPDIARPHFGGPVRIAKTGATGQTYPVTGSSFPITFIHLDSADAEVVRSNETPSCWNLSGGVPPESQLIVVYEFRGRWYTQWCCDYNADVDYSSCVGVFSNAINDSFSDPDILRPGMTTGSIVSDGVLQLRWNGNEGSAGIGHCVSQDDGEWPLNGTIDVSISANGTHTPGTFGITGSSTRVSIGTAVFGYYKTLSSDERIVLSIDGSDRLDVASPGTASTVRMVITRDDAVSARDATVEVFYNGASVGTRTSTLNDIQFSTVAGIPAGGSHTIQLATPPLSHDPAYSIDNFMLSRSW